MVNVFVCYSFHILYTFNLANEHLLIFTYGSQITVSPSESVCVLNLGYQCSHKQGALYGGRGSGMD